MANRNLLRALVAASCVFAMAALSWHVHHAEDAASAPKPPTGTAGTMQVPPANIGSDAPMAVADATPVPPADCAPVDYTADWRNPDKARRDAELSSAAAILRASPSADDVLASAIIDPAATAEDSAAAVERSLADAPDSPLIAWVALNICRSDVARPQCDIGERLGHALRVDGGNGLVLAVLALQRYRAGDAAGALQALERAATAPEFNAYWPETIRMFDRSLAASSDFSASRRAVLATGTAAAIPWQFGALREVCRETTSSSLGWANACDAFGERLAQPAMPVVGRMLGLDIRQGVAEATTDVEAAALVRERLESMTGEFMSLTMMTPAIFHDPAMLADYLDDMVAEGELAAMQRARARFVRAQSGGGANICGAG